MSRLEKLEVAREEQLRKLSDEEFESEVGAPGLMTFLYMQSDEDLDLQVAHDVPTSRRLWRQYLTWHEESQL